MKLINCNSIKYFLKIIVGLSFVFLGLVLFPKISKAASVDLSTYLPPVGNQGSQNSCASWAAGYYYKTAHEKMDRDWDQTTTDHQCSASFVYNHVAEGVDIGSYLYESFEVLRDIGCAPRSSFPHTYDETLWPTQAQFEAGMSWRSSGYTAPAHDRTTLKAILNSGNMFTIGIKFYSDYLSATGGNDVYDGPRGHSYVGGHGITVVGYDDDRAYTDINGDPQTGAFKAVNSWGSSWSGDGFFWISYPIIESGDVYELYSMTDRLNYTPTTWMRYDLTHPTMGSLYAMVAVGSIVTPNWAVTSLDSDGGNNPGVSGSIDISTATSYLPPSAENTWFLRVANNSSVNSGTIDLISIVHNGLVYSSSDTFPITIGTNSSDYAYIDGSQGSNNPPTQPSSVAVSPSSPVTANNLTCSASGSTDPDSDSVTYNYSWYKNGVLQSGQTSATLSNLLTAKGEIWRCVATPVDEHGLIGPTNQVEKTIGNTAPNAPSVSLTPSNLKTTDNIICNASASDPDSDSVSYTYAWYKNDVLQGSETSATLNNSLTVRGETWKCVATPNDGTADGSTGNSQIVVQNSVPVMGAISNYNITVGESINFTVSATDGDSIDTLIYFSTGMPAGSTFSPITKQFSWTTTTSSAGTYTLGFHATDSIETGSRQIQIVVNPVAVAVVVRTGDVNQDGSVNLLDLSIIATYWNHNNPANPNADINSDGVVNLLDLSLFAANL